MHSKKKDKTRTSLALSSAALQQHYSTTLKRGGVFQAVKKPPTGELPPSSKYPPTFKQTPLPSELQSVLSCSWACEGCGHLSRQLHLTRCPTCNLCRVRVAASGGGGTSTAPVSLAHRLGLVATPTPPPSTQEWQHIESLASSRVFSSAADLQTCPICRSQCGLRDCVITSCAHIFHAACLGSMESLVGEGDGTPARTSLSCPLCRTRGYYARPTRLPALRHIHDCAVLAQRVVRGWMVRARLFNAHWRRVVVGQGGAGEGELPPGLFRAFLSKALRKCALGEFGEEATTQSSETRAALESADAALSASAASGRAAEAALAALLEKRRRGAAVQVQERAASGAQPSATPGAAAAGPGPGLKEHGRMKATPPVLLPSQQMAILKSIADRLVVLGSHNARLAGVRAVVSAAATGSLERSARGREEEEEEARRLGQTGSASSPPPPLVVEDWGAVVLASEALYGGEGVGGDCCVCLAPLVREENNCALLPCAHKIHGPCLDALEEAHSRKGGVGNRKSCPLCRKIYQNRAPSHS